MLELWSHPEKAAEDVFAVYRGAAEGIQAFIREQLDFVRPVDYEEPGPSRYMRCPWRFTGLPEKTRWMLLKMGFARNTGWQFGALEVPGTVALRLGCCLGLGSLAWLTGGAVGQGLLLLGMGGVAWGSYRWLQERQDKELAAERPDLLEMVELPGGTFWMGSADDDAQASGNERPRHQVTISPVHMSRYVITRGFYRKIVSGIWSSEWLRGRWQGDGLLPMTSINWFEAVAFCNALSKRQGLQPCYRIEGEVVHWDQEADGYRLPTEAEWEYAARAGTETRWVCGDTPDALGKYAWFEANAESSVHPVGAKTPNAWEFSDMAGNVWEWGWDWHGAYTPDAIVVPIGPPTTAYRVLRGGAYWDEDWLLRSAFRYWRGPEDRHAGIGFRVVRRSRPQP